MRGETTKRMMQMICYRNSLKTSFAELKPPQVLRPGSWNVLHNCPNPAAWSRIRAFGGQSGCSRLFGGLAAYGDEFVQPVTTWLRRLAEATVSQAEATLEVLFDADRQVGYVLDEPAQDCLRSGARFQFGLASRE